jgi:hypothetical protein
MSNATLLFGKPSFTLVWAFDLLVVGFVNPLTLCVGPLFLLRALCYLLWAFFGSKSTFLSYDYVTCLNFNLSM